MRQFAVIGLGRFGSSVARALSERGCQVLAVDIDEDKVQEFSNISTQAVCADGSDSEALKAVGISGVDVAIVSVGNNIEASILITLALKEMDVKEIIIKAATEDQGKVLEKIGATKVVFPEKEMGKKLADSLAS